MKEDDFPILNRKVNAKRLIYLDNAATTQKPSAVIKATSDFYQKHNANIHRGIHTLSVEATNFYEGTRKKIQEFIKAKHTEEVIFTKGTTESINLVVWSWGHENIHRGDEILLTEMEHHSNLVPWQILAEKKNARLKFIPVNKEGRLNLKPLNQLITKKTKLISLTHVSNVTGAVNPIEKIIKLANKKGVKVLIDGAQAIAREPVNVKKLNCDFYAFSGHKMYGPTGVGVLYAKKELLETMPPYQSGGSMIEQVTLNSSTWADLPQKFEAGTPPVAEVVGLGAAIDFINLTGIEKIKNYELKIMNYALKKLNKLKYVDVYGPKTAISRVPVFAFNVKGIPPHDLATILDELGIAIRTGHHCAMPLHEKLGIFSSARASLALYNTRQDVDALINGIKHAIKLFKI